MYGCSPRNKSWCEKCASPFKASLYEAPVHTVIVGVFARPLGYSVAKKLPTPNGMLPGIYRRNYSNAHPLRHWHSSCCGA